jgi:hypothetical protein
MKAWAVWLAAIVWARPRTRLRWKIKVGRWLDVLRLVPLAATLWCTTEVSRLAAQSTDSVYTMPWVTDSIGAGATTAAVYCVERSADWGSLVVIGKLTRLVPDTITAGATVCAGTPMFWDFPVCPAYAPPIGASPWVLVRCERKWFRFPLRRPQGTRAS